VSRVYADDDGQKVNQLAINYEAPRMPALSKQQALVLAYLETGRTLTVGEALEQLGVYALSQRCGELRRLGWPIQSEMVTTSTGKRIARYSLERSNGMEAVCANT
jgi:hypothetical protein